MNSKGWPDTLTPFTPFSWKTGNKTNGGSTTIRVPTHLAATILEIAHQLDLEASVSKITEFITPQGEIVASVTEAGDTNEDTWFEEFAGFKLNEDGSIPDEIKEEIENLEEETEEIGVTEKLSEKEIDTIYQEIMDKDGGNWSVEHYAWVKASRDNEKANTDPNDEEKIERYYDHLNGTKIDPEIDDFQMEQFIYHLQIANAVWQAYASDDFPTEPNYHRIQVNPDTFLTTADWLVEKNLHRNKDILAQLETEWLQDMIEKEAYPHAVELLDEEEASSMDFKYLCEAAEFCHTRTRSNINFENPNPRSWYFATLKKYKRQIKSIIKELDRVCIGLASQTSQKRKPAKGFGKKELKATKNRNKIAEMKGKR